MATTVKVKGLSELNTLLQTLPEKLQKNVMRGAMRAAAKPILSQAVAMAPVDSGDLKRSLKIRTENKRGIVKAVVKTDLFYSKFVEFGTAAHKIVAPANGALRFGDVSVAVVDHPGGGAQPFMRPALDSKATEAVVAAGEYMKKRLATKHGLDSSGIDVEVDE